MARNQPQRFSWKLPAIGIAAAAAASLPDMLFGNDLGALLLTLVLVPCAALTLLIAAAVKLRPRVIASLAMLACFCVSVWIFQKTAYDIHTTARWLAQGKQYKAMVVAQSSPPNGELKHVEWDGWGFAGSDTLVYLVFDPNDLLSGKYEEESGPPPGIACKVPRIRCLENHWYAVTFYTDTSWDRCE